MQLTKKSFLSGSLIVALGVLTPLSYGYAKEGNFPTALETPPKIEWQKSLGDSDSDVATSIQQTKDGGYIVAGANESEYYNWDDYGIVKLKANGAIEWQKSYGGSAGDRATSIQQTKDGGYIVAGYSVSNDKDVIKNNGRADYWILKLSANGTIEWQKSYGGSAGDSANSIQQTKDGGYIVAGYSESNDKDVTKNNGKTDYWIIKLNESGTIEWQKSYGGGASDVATSIQQTKDGGYIVAGYSESNDKDVTKNNGEYDYWIVKLNAKGTIEWQKSLGGSEDDVANSIQQTKDGGYIVAGYSESNDKDVTKNNGEYDYWIIKLKANGAIEWQKSYGGSAIDVANSIQQTNDGGYIVAGYSESNDKDVTKNNGDYDYWIVKLK